MPIPKAVMYSPMRPNIISVRILSAITWFSVCLLTIAAPVLAAFGHSMAAGVLYLLLAPFCHQDPQRSFILWNYPWAVCQRCTGIYLGLFVAALVATPWVRLRPEQRRAGALIGFLPLLLDVLLPFAGLWTSHALTRFLTGMIFGMTASSFLVLGLTELLDEILWRRSEGNIQFKTKEARYES